MICAAVQTAQNRLIETGLALEHEFHGCTEEEILSIEDHYHVQLPTCYRDFLRVMGRFAGIFMTGSDYSYPKMLGFRDGAEALLQIYQPQIKLPLTALVFFSHQGYNYEWFICDKPADDPPVFLFNDQDKEAHIVAGSFSAWLLGAVDDDIAAYRGLGRG